MNCQPVSSLSPEEIAILETRLRETSCCEKRGYLNPSSEDRFLGWHSRDKATLNGYGITYKQIADCLDSLLFRAREVWRQSVTYQACDVYGCEKAGAILDRKFHVIAAPAYMCMTPCPFPSPNGDLCDARVTQNYTIINLEINEQVEISSIFSHIVSQHGFFGGNTELRIAPERLIRVLDLISGKDYALKTTAKLMWTAVSGSFPVFKDEDLEAAREYSKGTYAVLPNTEIHLLNFKDWFIYKVRDLTRREWESEYRRPKSAEEWDAMEKAIIRCGADPDQKMWEDRGEKFLHLFTTKHTRLDQYPLILTIEGGELVPRADLFSGSQVYKLSKYDIPVLNTGDILNVEKYQEWAYRDALWKKTVEITHQVLDFIGRGDEKKSIRDAFIEKRGEIYRENDLSPEEKLERVKRLKVEFTKN